jgi:hypothetical protein
MDEKCWSNYQTAKVETKHAYSEYSLASRNLELARIKERLAEIKSQHEPVHAKYCDILDKAFPNGAPEGLMDKIRDSIFWACDYVVMGKNG